MTCARWTTRGLGRSVATLAAATVLALPLAGATTPAAATESPAPVRPSPSQSSPGPSSPGQSSPGQLPSGQPPLGQSSPAPSPSGRSSQQPQGQQQEEAEITPLSVVLSSMSPPQVPRRGAVSLAGVVTNTSRDAWADLNAAPFVSSTPITTRDELAAAAATAADVAVGERLTAEGTNVALGDLDPGESAPFSLRVPVSALGSAEAPGVYWIGVHVLGTGPDGRDLVADGRVRTFIPLVTGAAARRTAPVSLVLPLRERARRAEDGSLNGPARWAAMTRPNGRLSRLADFAGSAGGAAVSWLVDPAVLDALEDFGRGNPPLTLGPARRADEEPAEEERQEANEDPSPEQSEGPSEGGSPSADDSVSPGAGASATPDSGAPSETEQARATAVLRTFLASAGDADLLTLGYADPDVAALARRRPALVRRAAALAARSMAARELTGRPAVAPPDGYFDPDVLDRVPRDTVVVLSDLGQLSSPVLSRLPTGQELLLGDQRAAAGGPAPTAADDPLAMRQRILSEAALEVSGSTDEPRPVVVVVRDDWNPGPRWQRADFFAGLTSIPWVRLAPAPRNAATAFDGELSYSQAHRAEELGRRSVVATRTLVRTSIVLDHLLANNNDTEERLAGAALQATSYSARPAPRFVAAQVLGLDARTTAEMGRVQVTGTDFVTLSGGSGSLTVTLVNGLEQPITVGLRARADSPRVRVETPEAVDMQPGQRTTLRLRVTSGVGVHDVTLSPVTTAGEETGTPLTFSLRTSEVGQLIWYIIIAGGVLLAVMIVRRIVLRVRHHRWREEPQP